MCLPLCATFSQYTDQVRISEDIIIITSGILAVIGGVSMVTVAVIRRKEMLALIYTHTFNDMIRQYFGILQLCMCIAKLIAS